MGNEENRFEKDKIRKISIKKLGKKNNFRCFSFYSFFL